MIRKQSYCTVKFFLLKSIRIGFISLFTLMGVKCTPNTTPSIEVTELAPRTVLMGGDINPEIYTVGKQHRYQVEVKVNFLTENANFDLPDTAVSIIWINPFTNKEEFAGVDLKPGTDNIYAFILPDSENLDICQAYFYRWSIVYNLVNGERGVYFGEEQYVIPTRKQISANQIEEASCLVPTSPWK